MLLPEWSSSCATRISEKHFNLPTMPRRAAFWPKRGIRGTRIPRGKARIVRGFCEFAGTITIVRNSAPFRAIWSADLRVRARI